MENEKEWKLAKKIYQTLKDEGALIGNASIHIIEKVLIVENETTHDVSNTTGFDGQGFNIPGLDAVNSEVAKSTHDASQNRSEEEAAKLAEDMFPMDMIGGGISKSDRQLQQNAFKKGYKAAYQNNNYCNDVYNLEELIVSFCKWKYCFENGVDTEEDFRPMVKDFLEDVDNAHDRKRRDLLPYLGFGNIPNVDSEEAKKAASMAYPTDDARKNMHHDNLGQISRQEAFIKGVEWQKKQTK